MERTAQLETVITVDNDDRIVAQCHCGQRIHQLTNLLVHVTDGGIVCLPVLQYNYVRCCLIRPPRIDCTDAHSLSIRMKSLCAVVLRKIPSSNDVLLSSRRKKSVMKDTFGLFRGRNCAAGSLTFSERGSYRSNIR